MNALSSTESRSIRVLSPRILPPEKGWMDPRSAPRPFAALTDQMHAESVDERALPGPRDAGDSHAPRFPVWEEFLEHLRASSASAGRSLSIDVMARASVTRSPLRTPRCIARAVEPAAPPNRAFAPTRLPHQARTELLLRGNRNHEFPGRTYLRHPPPTATRNPAAESRRRR